jgi:hypothetical protein
VTRFCPLHGDYAANDDSTQCPTCRHDPIGSSISLRQVKVVPYGSGMNEPDTELTPIADVAPCPICGNPTPLDKFRAEAIGEIWDGRAAEYAEEGVCHDCYRDVVAPGMRSWSNAEWLVHHYEGWRTSLEKIHDVFVFDESPQESWLPPYQRSRVLSVEKTIQQRKAHLRRSHMAMLELLGKHSATLTPPPFQMAVATATEAVSPAAIILLEERRSEDLADEEQRRSDSIMARAPLQSFTDSVALSRTGAPANVGSRIRWALVVGVAVVLGAAIGGFLIHLR